MRVLLTVHQFVPDFAAGTEILTLDSARGLTRLGHKVMVFTGYPAQVALRDDERFDRYRFDGIPVERFHHAYVPMGGQDNTTEAEYNNRLVAEHFRKLVRDFRPQVAHFFHLMRLSASVVDVCLQEGIATVLTPTDFWVVCPTCQLRLPDGRMCIGPDPSGVNCLRHLVALTQPPVLRARVKRMPDWALALGISAINRGFFRDRSFPLFVRALYQRPRFLRERMNMLDRVLVPTRLMENILKGNGLRAEKIVFCPYGINLANFNPGPRQEDTKLRVGFIGTLYEHKGVHVLLQAVRTLPAQAQLELKIYGRTDEFPAYVEGLKRLAAGDSRIRFCGTFPNHQIGEVFSQLDVLVVPSIWYENTPLVIYSAQAARCPVIASNLGGMAEVIHHGINGLLFAVGDVAGLGHILAAVAEDRQILQRLSQRARQPKSMGQYVQDLDRIYGELVPQQLAAEASSAPTTAW